MLSEWAGQRPTASADTAQDIVASFVPTHHCADEAGHAHESEDAQGEVTARAQVPQRGSRRGTNPSLGMQVEIKTTPQTTDAGHLQKAADFVHAYMLGGLWSRAVHGSVALTGVA